MRVGKPSKRIAQLRVPEVGETLTVESERDTFRVRRGDLVGEITGVFEEVCVHFEDFTLCLTRGELEKLTTEGGS
jgi:hypothetical protein